MMKKIAVVGAAVVATAAFAAPAQAAPTSVYGYKSYLASQGVAPTSSAVKAGKSLCQAKDAGVSWNRITRIGLNSGLDTHTLAVIMTGAVYQLCPWNTRSFNRWINS